MNINIYRAKIVNLKHECAQKPCKLIKFKREQVSESRIKRQNIENDVIV